MIKITFKEPEFFFERGKMFETAFECYFMIVNKIERSENYIRFPGYAGLVHTSDIKSIEYVKPTDL